MSALLIMLLEAMTTTNFARAETRIFLRDRRNGNYHMCDVHNHEVSTKEKRSIQRIHVSQISLQSVFVSVFYRIWFNSVVAFKN